MPVRVEALSEKYGPGAVRAAAPSGPAVKQAVGFWHGRPLTFLRRMCLASQVKQGYNVTLFSYESIDNLPRGVVNKDAEAIIPLAFKHKLERIATRIDVSHRATIQLSDFLRVRLQKLGMGVWLDTDLYLLRPMNIDRRVPYFAWESVSSLGNAVLYLPPAHPIVDRYEKLMQQDNPVPDWVTFRQRLKVYLWRCGGTQFNPSDLKLALFGPAALTALARRAGAMHHALPRRSFYAIHARHRKFFHPANYQKLLRDPGLVGLHLSPKARELDLPTPGSLYEWAARNVGMKW